MMLQYKLRLVGERNCGFDGCNALEFRTSGYCLRHKEGKYKIFPLIISRTFISNAKLKTVLWTTLLIAYIPIPIITFNMIGMPEPPGAIAPTGLLDIPCFICTLSPLLIGLIVVVVHRTVNYTTQRSIIEI